MVPVTILRHTAHCKHPCLVASLRNKFGQKLRRVRIERRLTQEKFAEAVGISVDFLSLVERGVNAPSFETLEKMAKRLRLPVAELFMFD